MDLKIGEIIYIIQSIGITCRFIKGEILNIKGDNISVAALNKNKMIMDFYIYQFNISIVKNKNDARLIFIAKLCRKKDMMHDIDIVIKTIKENTGLTDTQQIKEEIKISQSQFPELWL